LGVRVFAHIVKHHRCDYVVGGPRALHHRGRLKQVDHEWGAVSAPDLTRVALEGELNCPLAQRKIASEAQAEGSRRLGNHSRLVT
jgi:hypothetical protein